MRLRNASTNAAGALLALLLPGRSTHAQRVAITAAPEVTRLPGAWIYHGMIFLPPIAYSNYSGYFPDGRVSFDASTLVGGRVQLTAGGASGDGAARWSAYVAYARGATTYRGRGRDGSTTLPALEMRTHADATIALVSLGVLRSVAGPWAGLRVEGGLGATLLRLRADPAFMPSNYGLTPVDAGPPDRDYASPGGELSLAAEQRVRGRVGVRVQGALVAVRNDTEGMDGGSPYMGPHGKSAQWARAIPVSFGITLHL